MKHNQPPHNLVPVQLPKPEEREDLNEATFGRRAVEAADNAAYYDVTAGRHEDAADEAERLQTQKRTPDNLGRIRTRIGRRIGSVMTPQEARLVNWSNGSGTQSMIEAKKNMASSEQERASRELGFVRKTLMDLKPNPFLDRYISQSWDKSAPSFLKEAKGEGYSWRKWLANDASDEQLTNFLQWHVHETHKRQTDPEVRAEIEARRQEYKDSVTQGIKDGWLSPDGQSAVERADATTIQLGDVFELSMQGMGGYHIRDTDSITVSDPDKDIYHELNHAVLGQLGPRWRDEAVTTHIERSIENGGHDVLDPSKRADEGEYEDERTLLTVALKDVPVSLVTRAYSAKGANKKIAERRLDDAINRAWSHVLPAGKSVLTCIDQRIEQLEKEQLQEDDRIDLGIIRMRAVLRVTSELQEDPSKVFGKEEPKPEVGPAPQFDAATVAAMFSLGTKVAQRNAARPTPRPQHAGTTYSPEAVSEVDSRVSALRTSGMSDKAIYREVAKELHPDTSGSDEREKIQYLNEWRDRATHSETRQAA